MIPTRRLLVLLLLGSLVIAGVSVTGLSLVAILYFLTLLGVVIVDYAISPRPAQIEVERLIEPKLSLGAPNLVRLRVTNRSARLIRAMLRDEYPYQLDADQTVLHAQLLPFATCELHYHVTPARRGEYHWGDLNLRYPTPLGLLQRQARYPAAQPIRVYPNVLNIRKYDLLARKGLLHELGLRTSRIYGGGTEFERLREYTPDDEFRRINWKATARRLKPIAMEYEAERSQQVVCAIDTGRLMRTPIGALQKVDHAINAALLASYVATLRGDQIGLLTFADQVSAYLAPGKGRSQFYTMLELLYNVESQPVEADYARALGYLSVKNRRRSLIVVFSDLVTLEAAQPLIAHLARLARHHLPLLVLMSDPHVTRSARQTPQHTQQLYERAVAEQLLAERRLILDTLQRAGVLTLDVPADQLSVALINKYLELKTRGAL
ncbi:DUF58 domain-containing protein [Kallotenue papyrolyticum]|uniref:DUF58 domain-containing protein n=1 Tax=Kallotenue papyrolyticum TaxID=1325125 RepID=UPI000478580D|nr:DUF58 domain-containing protein [Kallotenue papyrolyticum]